MNEYISVSEFARLTGKSETYIRRLCRENKVPYIQEQLPNSTTLKYMIDISTEEAKRHIRKVSEVTEQVPAFVPEESSETILELVGQIRELSKQAGKVELLEDIRKREESNTKYWQDKYFELQNQIQELNTTIAEQKAQLAEPNKKSWQFWKK